MGRSRPDVRIGISGWTYAPWRGVFYPPKLPHKQELPYVAERLNSVEINGTFYSLQRPSSFQRWYELTPPDFLFSVKGPRFVTHMKKLRDVGTPMANFFASGVLALKEKLGPVLWQLPPNLGFHEEPLAEFLAALPRSTTAAAQLAGQHDERLEGRALTTADADRPIRHALEVRHKSFVVPRFCELLREQDVALVVADTAGRWPLLREVTSDFVYVRLHGDSELYTSGYDEDALRRWVKDVVAWRDAGHDVFVYFDNDVKVRAPVDAMALLELVSLPSRSSSRS